MRTIKLLFADRLSLREAQGVSRLSWFRRLHGKIYDHSHSFHIASIASSLGSSNNSDPNNISYKKSYTLTNKSSFFTTHCTSYVKPDCTPNAIFFSRPYSIANKSSDATTHSASYDKPDHVPFGWPLWRSF
jgi:hypothetical protein